jgi:UDPglucose 6-dehydrogenase
MIGKLARKVIFDGRNLYTTDQMKKAGFTYFSIGRKSVKKSK